MTEEVMEDVLGVMRDGFSQEAAALVVLTVAIRSLVERSLPTDA